MTFKSYTFIFFLIMSLLCYYLIPKKHQWLCLLSANIIFYIFSGLFNFVFILLTSVTIFLGALKTASINSKLQEKKASLEKEQFKIEKTKSLSQKRRILFLVLFITLGILAFLKYWNPFFAFIDSKTTLNLA